MSLGALSELLVERKRRDGTGRVVRVVDPDDRGVGGNRVEVGQEAVLAHERQRVHVRAGEERAALVDGIRGLAIDNDVLVRVEYLREREDRLFRSVGWDDLRFRIDLDPETSSTPAGGGLAKLRQPGGERVGSTFRERVDERPPDHRVGRLVRIALAEVDHLDALREQFSARLLEANERVGRHLGERRVDHERNVRRVSYASLRFSIGTRSSCRCANAVRPGP